MAGPTTDVPKKQRTSSDAPLRFFLSRASQEPESNKMEGRHVDAHRSAESEPNRTHGSITVDPSVGTGMFHRATLSKLCTRADTGSIKAKDDEWADTRRYDPYELVRTKKQTPTASAQPRSFDSHIVSPSSESITSRHLSSIVQVTMPKRRIEHEDMDASVGSASPLNRSYNLPFECSSDDENGFFSPTVTASESVFQNRWSSQHTTPRQVGAVDFHQPQQLSQKTIASQVYLEDMYAMELETPPFEETTPREQIFAMEMEIETPTPTHYERLLREPGPAAW